MGRYGKFNVATDLHVIVGGAEVDLPAGDFEPSTEDEYLACKQYIGVSFKPAGADHSEALVDQLEGPDPDAPAAGPSTAAAEAPGPSPAAQTGPAASAETDTPAGSQLADAEAEEEKAQADLKATAGDKPLYTFAGEGTPDPAAWPKTDLETTDEPPKALYTFAGDTAGAAPTAASAEWVVYTGPVQAAS